MNQSVLIFCIVCCSIIGGVVGSFIFTQLPHLGISSPSEERRATTADSSFSLKGEGGDEGVVGEESGDTQKIDLFSLENTINTTVRDIAPSVVSIIIKKDMVVYRSDPWGFFQEPAGSISRQVGGGSGFFIRKDGTIITNKHVVRDRSAEYTVILNTGEEYDAEIIALDPINDLAIIKISDMSRDFTPLEIVQDISEIEVGDFSIAVGNALAEFQNSVSLGIVSAKNRSIEAGGETLSGLLQTDAAINPGNSGGPLINLKGKVIGINTAIASNSTGIGFAFGLTKNRADYMLESIATNGRIMRPFIGINYIPNSLGIQKELGLLVDYGAYVIDEQESVVRESAADKAGISPGDIILEVNDEKIIAGNSLSGIIQNSLPGDELSMKILSKSGQEKNITLTLGAY